MTSSNYDAIERSFTDLLDSVLTDFSGEELSEIRNLIDVTEYGLALQTFVDIVVDEQKHISSRAATICEELARLMEFTDEIDLLAVRDAVKS